MTDEQHDAAARRKVEEAAQAALLQQTWDEQNAWMDEYRQRLGPREGYAPSPPRYGPASSQLDMHICSHSHDFFPSRSCQ
jgi:hypothetical protein